MATMTGKCSGSFTGSVSSALTGRSCLRLRTRHRACSTWPRSGGRRSGTVPARRPTTKGKRSSTKTRPCRKNSESIMPGQRHWSASTEPKKARRTRPLTSAQPSPSRRNQSPRTRCAGATRPESRRSPVAAASPSNRQTRQRIRSKPKSLQRSRASRRK